MENVLTIDRTVGARRYVLCHVASGALAHDAFMTRGEAAAVNEALIDQCEPWRWMPWREDAEAA